jgi:glycosyl hydrolase family 26
VLRKTGRARSASVVAAATFISITAVATPSFASVSYSHASGVYHGPATTSSSENSSRVAAFEAWRNADAGLVNDFTDGNSWQSIESSWTGHQWGATAYKNRMLITYPMLPEYDSMVNQKSDTTLPANTTTTAKGAHGDYDAHWKAAAAELVKSGLSNAVIRPGWESNGNWFTWSSVVWKHGDPAVLRYPASPTDYATYFQHIVTAMRSVAGANFTFEWNVALGSPYDLRYYPGDNYVDVLGIDGYDLKWEDPTITPANRWNHLRTEPQGLDFWATWAKGGTGHKVLPMAFSEWGLTNECGSMTGTAKCGGGGDDPLYVQNMHDWFDNHYVAYETYFDYNASDGSHDLENVRADGKVNFPNAAKLYQTLFARNQATNDLRFSTSSTRSADQHLGGASVSGNVYIFAANATSTSRVDFYIDDQSGAAAPYRSDTAAPFDLNGGSSTTATAYPSTKLTNGTHIVTIKVTYTDGSVKRNSAAFTVAN